MWHWLREKDLEIIDVPEKKDILISLYSYRGLVQLKDFLHLKVYFLTSLDVILPTYSILNFDDLTQVRRKLSHSGHFKSIDSQKLINLLNLKYNI